ncbi:DNA-binding response regulator, OmpR family, contains REC and winged-helix (wHTH) domain [Pseudobutyrivibrio sp. YE44]|uniref:response regulator transcription factor n=1 Tax=Pseudobutyrivibrio sp. YE44 TaxID=1520802 RepID=UPI000886C8E5|nr:response regulator transcription factor [Pseudobutyrivibrio sp. YE44]SDB12916.1 DNA-binding response regulator, OmpR family, contains REC and winged-helix (wHTH) domain [Pseudobutyrivibrio sp. YE44]
MRILAIDDELDILKLIEKALRGQYQVDIVQFPLQELPKDLSVYNLIIMDVMMPEESGYNLLGKIRDIVDCPIIFLSAKALEEDVIYGLSIGADDYIRKPFSIAELRARIAAHIRRDNRETIGNVLRDEQVLIYPNECRLEVKGTSVGLTKSEFDIAVLLFKNKGQVFSKGQIYEIIYGYDKDGDESAIVEHVKNLRKKLKKYGIEPVETVWGVGYRWKRQM